VVRIVADHLLLLNPQLLVVVQVLELAEQRVGLLSLRARLQCRVALGEVAVELLVDKEAVKSETALAQQVVVPVDLSQRRHLPPRALRSVRPLHALRVHLGLALGYHLGLQDRHILLNFTGVVAERAAHEGKHQDKVTRGDHCYS